MRSNKNSKQNLRKAVILISGILLIINFWLLDYDNLFSRENLGKALGGLSNILLMAAMLVSIRHTKKERENADS
ncbi:hypothetical protein [Salinimicrobium sediminilitoris]|uniref:hypothetical protein n=1 Tax=Salinimicrobium sediminilitoris TaxID=2876715 RepID=UPI001E4B2286|nr:hypothetical protein [Salinimicrobium sediminilitoris]MCC8360168.1 hypothetical protein [Salinimicrobium sediminilitoris]